MNRLVGRAHRISGTVTKLHLSAAGIAGCGYATQLPPRRVVHDSEIEEAFLKGSGPGGQKINKTNSAVQLKHLPTGIVVKSQETRSRSQNRKIARQLLGEKLDQLEKGDESRTALKAATKIRKKASADKKKRRKYRKLEEEQEGKAQAQAFDVDRDVNEHELQAEAEAVDDDRGGFAAEKSR